MAARSGRIHAGPGGISRTEGESPRGRYFGAGSLRQLLERQSSQKNPQGPQPESMSPKPVSTTTSRAFLTIRQPQHRPHGSYPKDRPRAISIRRQSLFEHAADPVIHECVDDEMHPILGSPVGDAVRVGQTQIPATARFKNHARAIEQELDSSLVTTGMCSRTMPSSKLRSTSSCSLITEPAVRRISRTLRSGARMVPATSRK